MELHAVASIELLQSRMCADDGKLGTSDDVTYV